MVNTDKKLIDKILNRGSVVDALPCMGDFRKKLESGEKLRIYIGADPTSPALHLSHAKNYMLLEEFRQLGHEVIVLIGDFTARIGDPSGQGSKRKQLTREEVQKNVEGWKDQIRPLMDFDTKDNPPQILYNHDWLSKLTFEDLIEISSNFTAQQMLERDMFQERLKKQKPIFLHEFMYPLMQGYDSVHMDVDVEMCGSDQIFNALVGRTMLKKERNKEKFVLVLDMMENPKTGELMSKSRGTGVFLSSTSSDMFGAIMSQPDEMTRLMLINNTRMGLLEVDGVLKEKPMDAKKKCAFEIVKIFHGEKEAERAQKNFEEIFQKKELPEGIQSIGAKNGDELKKILLSNNIVDTSSEYRRLVNDGAIDFDGNTIEDTHYKIKKSGVARVGKKKFVKIELF
ncbi:MAG: tyrosine--tRNA ligase [Patescibacteria group bacterium]